MAHRHPCYRHPRGVWMAACPECTAWYQPVRTGSADGIDAAAAEPAHADEPARHETREAA